MLFTDTLFLFYFLPFALVLHRVAVSAPGQSYGRRAGMVFFFLTLVFYASKEPWWLIPFFISVVFDFVWAKLIYQEENLKLRRFYCLASVIQNLGLLAAFKYRAFIIQNIGVFYPPVVDYLPSVLNDGSPLALPAGISFYTFESLSFVIDVYRKSITPPKKLYQFLVFLGMFPRFIAGPIVRYKEMIPQFQKYQGMKIEKGLTIFFYGMFLKCCFADNFSIFSKYAFDKVGVASDVISAWIGLISYSLQIYFDFSGYSLMAIGLGICFGFNFPVNFNSPYHADTLKEFWRRWHISLSTWLRDYLYLPLGGSQSGKLRTLFNIFITMALGGLWHGSSWNFILWGVWHGFFLCIERVFPFHQFLPRKINQMITLLVVFVGWVPFRSQNGMAETLTILKSLFTNVSSVAVFNPEGLISHPLSLTFCSMGVLYAIFIDDRVDWKSILLREDYPFISRLGSLLVGALALLSALSQQTVPFLYFQF